MQREYELVYNEMQQLTTEEILAGCRVFEQYGMDTDVLCGCFVQHVEHLAYPKLHINDIYTPVGDLSDGRSLRYTYGIHLVYPEIVFLTACDILEERGA